MRNAIITAVAACFALSALTSCGSDEERDVLREYSEHYIHKYFNMNGPLKAIQSKANKRYIEIGGNEVIRYSRLYEYDAFIQYAIKYGDLSYNRVTDDLYTYAYCNDFAAIDIVSDADFDADHPAGTSLADVMRIVTTSPYLYIQSGYDSRYEYDWQSDDVPEDYYMEEGYPYARRGQSHGYRPVNILVSELTPEDLIMVDHIFFVFAKQPDKNKEHTLTLTVTDAEHGPMSCSFPFVFE